MWWDPSLSESAWCALYCSAYGGIPDAVGLLPFSFLLASPIVFNVVALWSGQSALQVPQVPPYGMFNDRYGIMALPLFAVAIGVVAGRWRKTVPVLFGVAVLTFVLAVNATPLTVQDGRSGTLERDTWTSGVAAAYLRARYHGGEILADDSVASPFMFATGLDLREFITPGFHPYYQDALRSPASKRGLGCRGFTSGM